MNATYRTDQNSSSTSIASTDSEQASKAAMDAAASLQQRIRHDQIIDEKAAKYFAAAIAGLICLFTVCHAIRYIFNRYTVPVLKNWTIVRSPVALSRLFRRIAIRRVPGFVSAGHVLVVLVYIAVNLALTLTNLDWSTRIGLGKRCGWMSLLNLSLITFLALKNTPLGFLTASSYERLNCLHQIGGYTTIGFAILHAGLIVDYFTMRHHTAILLETPQISGIIAGSAMLVIGISAVLVKKVRYEAFYVIHIIMFMLIVINVGLHRPDFALKAVYITIFTGCLWATDRLIRTSRTIWSSYSNRAIIFPLPYGGTRIVLRQFSSYVVPGKHCFVLIPKIRAVEMHPFTIVSTTAYSMELVVAARDGFTKELHHLALKKPGSALRVAFDGPYGTHPNFAMSADKVVLIAGGSGASFTFGAALNMVRQLESNSPKRIEFIWVMKKREMISWFSKELLELQRSGLVNFTIHATSSSHSPEPEAEAATPVSPISPTLSLDPEKSTIEVSLVHASPNPDALPIDIENRAPALHVWETVSTLAVRPGRPDTAAMIRAVVQNAGTHQRVAVAACGPHGLMRVVRQTVATCITTSGPSVELHCEQFSW